MGTETLLVATPLRPGCDEAFLELLAEMRDRKDEVGASRRRVGFTRQVAWYQKGPLGSHSVVYFEGRDPGVSLQRLLASDDPFDRDIWGRMEPMFGDAKPPEQLRRLRRTLIDEEATELVQYIAHAVDVLPGRTERLRRGWAFAADPAEEERYLRLLGLHERTLWLQTVPWGDVAIYFASGDVGQSTEVLATSDDPAVVAERAFVEDVYGLDLTVDNMPMPQPTFAWSDSG